MSEASWIALIVAVLIAVVILILFVLRKQDVSRINFEVGNIKSQVETREAGSVSLKNIKQKGNQNRLDICRDSVHIENFEQKGEKLHTKIKRKYPNG